MYWWWLYVEVSWRFGSACAAIARPLLFVLVLSRAAVASVTPSAGGGTQGATRTPGTVCGKTKGSCWEKERISVRRHEQSNQSCQMETIM